MRLFIAEKKEVARAISDAFNGVLKDSLFYKLSNGDEIVWLSGHFLRLADPEEINEEYKIWSLEKLPMKWAIKLLPNGKNTTHLNFVLSKMEDANEFIHCGDPDAEGQRIVDEIIEFSCIRTPNNKSKKISRVLINDNNPDAIIDAVKNIEPNEKYKGLSQSALARAVGDQRYGYNLTRTYTLLAKKKGIDKVLSVGRVQTPILGLVVRRDKAIDEHQEHFFYLIKAEIIIDEEDNKTSGVVKKRKVIALYKPQKDNIIDDKGRLIDLEEANFIAQDIQGKPAEVFDSETKSKNIDPPLPYNLLALQADASKKYGFSPKKTLQITQSLRDNHKAITYNRSDCRYLKNERHSEAQEMLSLLSRKFSETENASAKIKSKAFNSEKVSAHHAIIPTKSVPALGKLSEDEEKIYDLIAKLYIAQFYPPRIVESTKIIFKIANYIFTATCSKEISAGWKKIIGDVDSDEDEGDFEKEIRESEISGFLNFLQQLKVGDKGLVEKGFRENKKTQPPKRYSMATLLKDLASVAKYVQDPKIRTLLLDKDADKADEKGGIGTPATRDSHIETLFTRGFIEEKGKQIISTDLGRQLINTLPEFATTPDMTALWHEKQKLIEAGQLGIKSLLDEIDLSVSEEIKRAVSAGLDIETDAPKCPNCESGYLKQRKGKYSTFWGCSNYPDCETTFPDKNGKPDIEAKKSSSQSVSPNSSNPKSSSAEQTEQSEHLCPKCQEEGRKGYLIRRPSKKNPKIFWWGCSEFRNGCDYTAFDNKGHPIAFKNKKESEESALGTSPTKTSTKTSTSKTFKSSSLFSSAKQSEYLCPKCQEEGRKGYLIRRPSKKDPKKFWWGCSEWKNGCDYTTFDNNGEPVLKKP